MKTSDVSYNLLADLLFSAQSSITCCYIVPFAALQWYKTAKLSHGQATSLDLVSNKDMYIPEATSSRTLLTPIYVSDNPHDKTIRDPGDASELSETIVVHVSAVPGKLPSESPLLQTFQLTEHLYSHF